MYSKPKSSYNLVMLLTIPLVIVGLFINGWAISTMWGWFVVPIFALPSLTIAQAVGVSCLLSLLKPSSSDRRESRDTIEIIGNMISEALFVPVIAVGFAWIVTLFL